jgi:enterochelin esterase-like enzyme
MAPCRIRVRRTTAKVPTMPSLLTRMFVALLLLPGCSLSVDDGTMPGGGGSGGASAGSSGASGSGGAVGTSGSTAGTGGSSPGTAGVGGTTGGGAAGAAGSGGVSLGGQGGATQGGTAGMAGTAGMTGGSDTGPLGGAPHVTPQNATSVPAMFGDTVAVPGKLTTKVMYPVYWYSTTASSSEAFKMTPTIPKQSTPVMKPLNVYTPPGYDKQNQYPLIVIMHGITDNENTWNERSKPNVAKLFDNLITSKATKPFIAVFALGTVNNTTNGYYAFGAELTNDLLPFIEANYSVRKDRGSRAMAGFSFGGMQTINIGLCAHLREFAWFAGLNAAGGNANATDIAKYVGMQNPQMYPLYYFYVGVGNNDGTAGGSSAASANGLATKGPYITTANFSFQNNIPGGHDYPTAEVSLYNFLRMAFAPS